MHRRQKNKQNFAYDYDPEPLMRQGTSSKSITRTTVSSPNKLPYTNIQSM